VKTALRDLTFEDEKQLLPGVTEILMVIPREELEDVFEE
jgi:hypothetical protein